MNKFFIVLCSLLLFISFYTAIAIAEDEQEICVISFNDNETKQWHITVLSCGGDTGTRLPTNGRAADDANMSLHLTELVNNGYSLISCTFYQLQDGWNGRECFLVGKKKEETSIEYR